MKICDEGYKICCRCKNQYIITGNDKNTLRSDYRKHIKDCEIHQNDQYTKDTKRIVKKSFNKENNVYICYDCNMHIADKTTFHMHIFSTIVDKCEQDPGKLVKRCFDEESGGYICYECNIHMYDHDSFHNHVKTSKHKYNMKTVPKDVTDYRKEHKFDLIDV